MRQAKDAFILALITIILVVGLPSFSLPGYSQSKKSPPAKETEASALYKRAQKELPEEFYVMYRITDRISRANSLMENPWRMAIIDKYDINAFATEVNLVALYTGIWDQISGDTSAKACLIGHEMAHHTHRHIALTNVQKAERLKQISKEVEQEVTKEVERARGELTTNAILGAVFGVNTSGFSRMTVDAAKKKIEEIKQQKKAQFEAEQLELSRQQEFEADRTGYTYAATAGFEPSGCIRLMEVLSRTERAEFDGTHPKVSSRIEALQQIISETPPQTLAKVGETRLRMTEPLTYDFSLDGRSLRINSKFGSSKKDLERLFGK